MTPNGVVLYQGPSRIDRMPVVCIATGFLRSTVNAKTGRMIQTWILRSDMNPLEAVATGRDVSICGGCPLKGIPDVRKRTCYVQVGQAPNSIFKALQNGRYPHHSHHDPIPTGLGWRLGSYGDPAAVPIEVWDMVFDKYQPSFHTGYTHQWKNPRRRAVLKYCQASVDSPADVHKLHAECGDQGYFRILDPTSTPFADELLCPASKEAGYMSTCAECQACDGSSKVAIYVHGSGKSNLPVVR